MSEIHYIGGFGLPSVVADLARGHVYTNEHAAVIKDDVEEHVAIELISVANVGEIVHKDDLAYFLDELCDYVHSHCSLACPYFACMFEKSGGILSTCRESILEKGGEFGCECFKNGSKMAEKVTEYFEGL